MANPIFVDCPKNAWTKVATNITSGVIHKVDLTPYKYLQTYRDTGGLAPTLKSDGVVIFDQSRQSNISSNVPIDVYIYPITDNGRVRVDI